MKFNINIYKLLFFGIVCVVVLCFSSCSEEEQKQSPNVIIFFTDDQGYADVGCYGATGFQTPNMDALAAGGIRFTDYYAAASVCTPSRAALLTGKYPKRVGLHEAVIYPYSTHGLEPEHVTLAELLKDQGYATSCIGKWHLGHSEKYMPNNQGFDSFYGVPYSNDMDGHYYSHNDFQSPPLPFYRNTEVIAEGVDQKNLTKMYTNEAVSQIKNRDKTKPFFMYVAHSMPHVPLHASEDFVNKSEKGLYGDVIMELDWSLGEIVSMLKEEGIFEETIVIFTSDNGPQLGDAGPLRGKKAETWEGGLRVPAIISWPDNIPAGKVSKEMVTALDLFPTILAQTNYIQPNPFVVDGRNISSHLFNPNTDLKDIPFFYYSRSGKPEAVRLGTFKLHIAKERGWDTEKYGLFRTALYNLESDIGERNNLEAQYPGIVESFTNLILSTDKVLEQDFN